MSRGFARFAKVQNGIFYFAEVPVRLESQTKSGDVAIDCQGTGLQGQGHMVTVPAVGYDDWKQGAVLGAKFALAAVKASSSVVVVEITGLWTDTNPSIVAAACAHAVWNALGVTPPEATLQHLNATALSSWERPCDALPLLL